MVRVSLCFRWTHGATDRGDDYAGLFYGIAGVRHVTERSRSLNENVAMLSDLFIFAALAAFVLADAISR
jgi:hypothetical protein